FSLHDALPISFLINLAMVFVKIIQEIVPNHILRLTVASQGIGNEFQIFIQSVLSIDSLYKFYETADNIILKVYIITDWDNIINIRAKFSIRIHPTAYIRISFRI